MKNTLKILGGETGVQHLSEVNNIDPNQFFINNMPELQELTPPPRSLTPDLVFLGNRRGMLIEKDIVLTDLRALAKYYKNPQLTEQIDNILKTTQTAIDNNRALETNILNNSPPHYGLISNSGLPSYVDTLRKK